LQLDELRSAERSPISRTDEHQHRPARPRNRLQIPDTAQLIAKAEVRDRLANLWPELGDVDGHPRGLSSLAGVRRVRPKGGNEEGKERREAK
jgi:hypothetical protein